MNTSDSTSDSVQSEAPVEVLRLFDLPPVPAYLDRNMGPPNPMTHSEMQAALAWYHANPYGRSPWLGFAELNTAELGRDTRYQIPQRIDYWALHCYRGTLWHGFSGGDRELMTVAYEVKVSRSDFLKELRDPSKREAAMEWSNLFYFACAPGIADKQEIPEGCGLVVIDRPTSRNGYREYRFKWQKSPTYRPKRDPSWVFVRTLGYAMNARIEAVRAGHKQADETRSELEEVTGGGCGECGEYVS